MKSSFFIVIIIYLFTSCQQESENCDITSFLGKWTVVDNICDTSTSSIEISQGSWPSKVKLTIMSETYEFIVLGCEAAFVENDFLVSKKGSLKIDGNELFLNIQTQVLILPIYCNMKLKRQ